MVVKSYKLCLSIAWFKYRVWYSLFKMIGMQRQAVVEFRAEIFDLFFFN